MPLFVSHRRLRDRRTFPRARAPWVLDSGGFTELHLHGEWQTTPAEYVRAVRRYAAEVGRLEWVAPMDYMCEPSVRARTGLSVAGHQARTVANFLLLRQALGSLVAPVLQGWSTDDYLACAELYDRAGVALDRERVVGLGSVCRRTAPRAADAIVTRLLPLRLRLHGFGVKSTGLALFGGLLASADSLAWSFAARRGPVRLEGCTHTNCANCPTWAVEWRRRLLSAPRQTRVEELAA